MVRNQSPIILFDGVCNLCNASVNFIIDRDPGEVFRFASLQSSLGHELLARFGFSTDAYQSVVLVEGDRLFTHSSAALRIAARLPAPWKLLYVFIMVPKPIRDAVYNWISRNRYAWFGKSDTCRIPTPELRSRFLE